MAKNYWLMKSEPDVYSIEHLRKEKKGFWDGVRNYQARNIMRDQMKVGDEVLFYHSNAKPSGVAGLAKVCKPASPDPTQFDKKSKYYDPKSNPDDPRWVAVTVEFVSAFQDTISLEELKNDPKLEGIMVARRGARLSVQPVSAEHFKYIKKLGQSLKAPSKTSTAKAGKKVAKKAVKKTTKKTGSKKTTQKKKK